MLLARRIVKTCLLFSLYEETGDWEGIKGKILRVSPVTVSLITNHENNKEQRLLCYNCHTQTTGSFKFLAILFCFFIIFNVDSSGIVNTMEKESKQ